MGTIEISELLSYAVPLLVAYNAWLHTQVINAQKEIAVNSAMDTEIIKQFDEFKQDIKLGLKDQADKIQKISEELHDFLIKQAQR